MSGSGGPLAALAVAGALLACAGPPTPGLARGQAVFETCVPCHGASGGGNRALGAPAIGGLPEWYVEDQLEKFQTGQRGANPDDTVGIRMKSMSLALDLAGDLESVAEYVATLPPSLDAETRGGDAEAGRPVFQTCQVCHGAGGEGNETFRAPPLAGQSEWYLVAQMEKFRRGWRGTHPADITGGTMRPIAASLDPRSLEDVVAYIGTLGTGVETR